MNGIKGIDIAAGRDRQVTLMTDVGYKDKRWKEIRELFRKGVKIPEPRL